LEELEDEDLRIITSYKHGMSWVIDFGDPALQSMVYLKRIGSACALFDANFAWEGEHADSNGEPRLFLLGQTKDYDTCQPKWDLCHQTPRLETGFARFLVLNKRS
jgi:hypothetical protein